MSDVLTRFLFCEPFQLNWRKLVCGGSLNGMRGYKTENEMLNM